MKKTAPALLAVTVAAWFAPLPAGAQDFVIPEVGPGRCVASCGGGGSSGGGGSGGSGDGLELLRAAVENASREPSPQPREYYIFAFSANRLPLDAVIELRLSDTPEGIEGHPGNSVQLDHQGWRTAVMRGTFARTAGEEFSIKAIYRPGAGTPIEERPPRLVAVVSSRGATVAVENAETVTAPALELAPCKDLAPRTGQADEIVAADDRQGVKRRLMEIEELLELKLITPEEFAKKRQQILDDL